MRIFACYINEYRLLIGMRNGEKNMTQVIVQIAIGYEPYA